MRRPADFNGVAPEGGNAEEDQYELHFLAKYLSPLYAPKYALPNDGVCETANRVQ